VRVELDLCARRELVAGVYSRYISGWHRLKVD